ncbi:hypothetical protein [Amycolatopsis thermoflava]|uniref:hypothetical protein n=1 Tax=Amycolatopsis thermoflava TaxID=84480 RepID=UPI003EBCE581
MAKKGAMIPMPTGRSGGEVLPKLVVGAVGLALLVLVIKHPSDAAHWLRDLINFGTGVVDSIATFIRQAAG